ncbi:MAG: hypothetical protein ACLQVY_11560 [Limisphaerales bacterium]
MDAIVFLRPYARGCPRRLRITVGALKKERAAQRRRRLHLTRILLERALLSAVGVAYL